MNKYEAEIPKYLKQKESNISKAKKKSKHKHQYEECLLQYDFNFNGKNKRYTCLSSYCTICGKTGGRFKEDKSIVKDFTRTSTFNGKICYCHIPDKELYEKYHDKMPIFFVEDYLKDGYVNLKEENKWRIII